MAVRERDDARLGALQGTAAGTTIQLAVDFLNYARERFDEREFKAQLIERLLPTVPLKGTPHPIKSRSPFGKFDVRGRLGKGGMAEVFLVHDPELAPGSTNARDSLLALKVMKKEIAHEGSYVTRFLREAANTALIDHHNVVKVQEVGSVEGRLYFTMELIEGETLKDYMAQGAPDEDQGVQILCQLVDGLMAAHERGIGHRDLKPSNVMLATSQAKYGVGLAGEFDVSVKITDFGLAEMLDKDVPADMPEGRFLGTAKYVAPEVAKGEHRTLKSDVFSLGILVFQMFAGRPPFRARNKLEYITANMNADAPPLDSLSPVTPELARVVAGMLVKDPKQRQGAEALRRDLGRLILRAEVGDPIEVDDDPESVFYASGGRAASGGPGASPAQNKLIAGAACLVLLIAVLGGLALRGGTPPPSPTPTEPVSVRPTASEEPTPTPIRTGGDPTLVSLPQLVRTMFRDRLARVDFDEAMRDGDQAWKGDDPRGALERWEQAQEACLQELPGLTVRLNAARHVVARTDARAAEQAGDHRVALRAWTQAVEAGDEDADRAALKRCQERVDQEDEVDRRLVEARGLEREAAIAELRDLLPLARRVGRGEAVSSALERLGVERDELEPEATPSVVDPAAQLRAQALLDRAEGLIERANLDEAEEALEAAERNAGSSARSRSLRERLERARGAQGGQ